MNKQILRNMVVTLDYNVKNTEGEIVDEGREPMVYLHGGYNDIFPKIEESLHEKCVGETVTLNLQADEAFGEYDPELVQVEPRTIFPKDLQVGMEFEGGQAGDEDSFVVYRVTAVEKNKVVLDGNHPLAGMALIFSCTVTDIRPASEEELERGYVGDDDEEDEDEDVDEPTRH